jgi:predicted Zn-dependent protease
MTTRSGAFARLTRLIIVAVAWGLCYVPMGCGDVDTPIPVEGPGHRPQLLALTPEEELELGREAYREILSKSEVLPPEHPAVQYVRHVGSRLVAATRIRPLLKEINLRDDERFEWEFNVIDSDRVNAISLPAGKVAVFSGLLEFIRSDDELATVLGHEMAHALVHRANERIAMFPEQLDALRASGFRLSSLDETRRRTILGLLDAGADLQSLSYNRFQESEADHIGIFLMTFAGYEPDAALSYWDRMRRAFSGRGRMLEILSDHPTDERRLAQLLEWVPIAKAAKQAYDKGLVAPESVHRTGRS